jgi:hypothetical protein
MEKPLFHRPRQDVTTDFTDYKRGREKEFERKAAM